MQNFSALEKLAKVDYNVQMLGLSLSTIISYDVDDKIRQEAIESALLMRDELFFHDEDVYIFNCIKSNINLLSPSIQNGYNLDPEYVRNIILSNSDEYLSKFDEDNKRQIIYKQLLNHVNDVVQYAYMRLNLVNVDHINRVKKALTDQFVAQKSQTALLDLENKQDNASGYLPELLDQLSKVQYTAISGMKSKDLLMDHLDEIIDNNDYGLPEVNIPFSCYAKVPNDMVNGGLKKRTFCIVAAPSHAGKTTWAIQQLIDILLANKKLYVTFYSVELQAEDLVLQIARSFCYQYPYQFLNRQQFIDRYLHRDQLSLEENVQTDAIAVKFFAFWLQQSGWSHYIKILGADKVDSIETLEKDIVNDHIVGKKPEVIFIDYLQALNSKPIGSKDEPSPYQSNTLISKKLSALTKKYGIRCFALSQVRDPETGVYCASNMPTATSIKDSRQYTQDADIIVTLCAYNAQKDDEYRLPEGLFTPRPSPDGSYKIVWYSIVKNRQGPISEFPRYFFNHKGMALARFQIAPCLVATDKVKFPRLGLSKADVYQKVLDTFKNKD
ncbi:DnaB-like helicase C-terminal domain-containing protein [Psittacicella hinzii]|uniref:SF4 helicase domain-containing protein n=1 Tax=Psittacicella hinzii TaxID=2028575 RepID=A0A3A1YEV2_9GAMM|nr:DnaB-like helicase C-terminal domain-containing protein [Psittacicella hinzii]RIY36205.1 hypothetical protein CKF58_06080 [Psittacicella hinzii]